MTNQSTRTVSSATAPSGVTRLVAEKSGAAPSRMIPNATTLRLECVHVNSSEPIDVTEKAFWTEADEVAIDKAPENGTPATPLTWVRMRWSNTRLFFYAEAEQPHQADPHNGAEKLWNGSNVEFLISPRWFQEGFYDEYEFLFNSHGHDTTLRWRRGIDLATAAAWQCEGFQWNVVEPIFHADRAIWAMTGTIPLSSLETVTPQTGDCWGIGLFRKYLDTADQTTLLAWSPPLTDPPKFHTPTRFGALVFTK